MVQKTGRLINLLDFCQPITDVYCGQLTNESVRFLKHSIFNPSLVNFYGYNTLIYRPQCSFLVFQGCFILDPVLVQLTYTGSQQSVVLSLLVLKHSEKIRSLPFQGGPENADKPFVWLKLEAISNFEDPENVKAINPKIYEFLENELNIEKVKIKF